MVDEMSTWYSAKKVCWANLDDNVVMQKASQESQVLSGPSESSCSKSVENPWKTGKTHEEVAPNVSRKGKEKVDEPPMVLDASIGHSIMGEDSSR